MTVFLKDLEHAQMSCYLHVYRPDQNTTGNCSTGRKAKERFAQMRNFLIRGWCTDVWAISAGQAKVKVE